MGETGMQKCWMPWACARWWGGQRHCAGRIVIQPLPRASCPPRTRTVGENPSEKGKGRNMYFPPEENQKYTFRLLYTSFWELQLLYRVNFKRSHYTLKGFNAPCPWYFDSDYRLQCFSYSVGWDEGLWQDWIVQFDNHAFVFAPNCWASITINYWFPFSQCPPVLSDPCNL